jgi:hypothetical protein
MTDTKAIAQQILNLPADLTEQLDIRILELCKGLDLVERYEVAQQVAQLLKDKDPALWKRKGLYEEDLVETEKGLELVRREAERGNEDAARMLVILELLEEEEFILELLEEAEIGN